MIKSMTGFGKSVKQQGTRKVTAEIRSLNNKQMDLHVRLPGVFKEKELTLRSNITKELERGKVDLSVYIEDSGGELKHSINKELALSYHKELQALADSLDGENQTDYLSLIIRMPEVMKSERQELDEEVWTLLNEAIMEAVKLLDDFRAKEGKVLEDDLIQRVKRIMDLLVKVEELEPQRMENIKKRIKGNLNELIVPGKIDGNRFEQEMIYYMEKIDVTEEKVRLRTHCEHFLETMSQEETQGKKLGFITQEIGREINTLGSKANHVDIQKLVVDMKDELEKIKEQVLNVL